jgi:nucleoside-diphosphate-sugar epimerase
MKRLLIAGFGDVARRAAADLERHFKVSRLARRYGFDLDEPETLVLEKVDALLHLAPPPAGGEVDTRIANLLAALERADSRPQRVVYVSTSGVYGDCGGARVDETRPTAPQTARAKRRLDAERRLGGWCTAHSCALVILRAPGIYAADRLPLERLRAPVLRAEEDVYTNHIHADDLAAIVARALEPDAPPGIYNACDDSEIKMGDWFDLIAQRFGLERPARLSHTQLDKASSFMNESRRLDNRRMKSLLGIKLRYPTVHEGLRNEHAVGID